MHSASPLPHLQVQHHLLALAQHRQQATAGRVVLLVLGQVLSQLRHAGSEPRNLHLGAAAVLVVALELRHLGKVGALAAVARAAGEQGAESREQREEGNRR
jgi:hypothetical protein